MKPLMKTWFRRIHLARRQSPQCMIISLVIIYHALHHHLLGGVEKASVSFQNCMSLL